MLAVAVLRRPRPRRWPQRNGRFSGRLHFSIDIQLVCSVTIMHLRAYARGLDKPERLRYGEKVRLCGGVDPLELKDAELQRDVGLLPRVHFTDIKDYLVHARSFVPSN
ncbi:hypothetical protein HPB49_020140 [Dermacentor silvarum]|uniref:Uncharacterized protein n=1 Tax=Dermacentor silvarum TaxID=543639 RepID=A0ACB8CSS9_DERSI|nr:hypothetical protein HPB49_020140 [Dermacentor silvarum]